MAQVDRRITAAQFRRTVRPVLGLRVSRPWLGYGDVLFLELGALVWETLVVPKRGPRRVGKGQATIMVHSDWKAEGTRRFAFGSGSPPGKLQKGTRGLRGMKITSICLQGPLPELALEFDRHLWIRSFRTYGPPDWVIFLEDSRIFPRARRWTAYDHSLWVGTSEEGHLTRGICYDPQRPRITN